MIATLFLMTALAQGGAEAKADDSARAAAAAEKAAEAAQKAAEAAQRAAEAAEKAVGQLAPQPEKTAEKPAEKKPSGWTATVGAGLLSLSGNSSAISFNLNSAAERKTDDWIFGLKAAAVYGQSRPPGSDDEPQTVALGGGFSGRGDRRFTERYSAYLQAGLEADHVKSVEYRYFGEAGVGIIWLDPGKEFPKAFLRTDVAARYGEEERFQYYPTKADPTTHRLDSVRLIAPRIAVAFKYGLTESVTFSEDLELMPNVAGPSRLLANSVTKLSARLSKALAFGMGFAFNEDTAPAAGKKDLDTTLSASVEMSFQ
jgi:hypothetical protein